MFTKYGKSCKKSSNASDAPSDNEKLNDTEKDDENADDIAKSNEETVVDEDTGVESSDNNNDTEENANKESTADSESANDSENGEGISDDGQNEDQVQGEATEDSESEEFAEEEEKKSKKSRGPLEYDITDMYPEMNILIQKKKKEWDFQDPDIIRALWLESKTHVLSEWKVRNAKIKTSKPSIEVRDTVTVTLRQEHLKNKADQKKASEEREFEMTDIARDPPNFSSMQLATNLTTEMRYKYTRNNPPVPSHYIEHFEKYKKPPFKNNSNVLTCKL